ncbi:MAG TPA: heavy metal-responsive transcriptional regulator [Candidatus Binataceae bacterium]|nr:heavy metal-responsive transcriptional regulator [Candidatus Binataceae bacterium]
MTIGRVAEAAGISIDTLRFYEREGLLARPGRNMSGYRQYPLEVLDRLRFIQDAKALGFTLREIKELLSMGVKSTLECGPVTRKAEAKLVAMDEELARLKRMRRTLARLIEACGGVCTCAKCSSNRGHSAHSAHNHTASSKRKIVWTS